MLIVYTVLYCTVHFYTAADRKTYYVEKHLFSKNFLLKRHLLKLAFYHAFLKLSQAYQCY